MKKSIYGVLAFAALLFTACGETEEAKEVKEENKTEEVVAETYTLNAEASSLMWEGSWTGGESDGKTHNGVVSITEGSVTKTGDDYEGTFTVDMTTIDVQDLDAESGKDKLQGHLASEDFFNVEAHGKVGVKLTQIVDGEATVAIEFLGNTMNETFPVEVSTNDNTMNISGKFAVDFAEAGLAGMQVNPEKPEAGNVSTMINFELKAELTK